MEESTKRKRYDDDDSYEQNYQKKNKRSYSDDEDYRVSPSPPRKFYTNDYKERYGSSFKDLDDEYNDIDSKYEEFKRRQRRGETYQSYGDFNDQEPLRDTYSYDVSYDRRNDSNFRREYSPPSQENYQNYQRREYSPPDERRDYSPPPRYRYNNRRNDNRRYSYDNNRRRNYQNNNYRKKPIVPKGISSKRILNTMDLSYYHPKDEYKKEDFDILEKNPHLRQTIELKINKNEFNKKSRILQDNAPGEEYRRRKGEVKTVNHWGQRKLLFSEIEFLTLHAENDITCIYAGAAPGTHIKYLSSLFPEVKFVLVDPSQFTVKTDDKISLIEGFFTDKLAEGYKDVPNLFISDIRTASWKTMSEEDIEKQVHLDMEAQQRWVKILNSKSAMLKFRLPYCTKERDIKEYEYLKGDIYLPIWGPVTTTETRLITDGKEMKKYNPSEYEKQMFYFNTKTRVEYYEHDINGEGLDHCYDCKAEIYCLEQYLKKYKPDVKDIKKEIEQMSYEISKELSVRRNLNHCSEPVGNDMDPSKITSIEIQRAQALTSVNTMTGEKMKEEQK
eukprot:gene10658-3282_t